MPLEIQTPREDGSVKPLATLRQSMRDTSRWRIQTSLSGQVWWMQWFLWTCLLHQHSYGHHRSAWLPWVSIVVWRLQGCSFTMVHGSAPRIHHQLSGAGKEPCALIHCPPSQEDVNHQPFQHTKGSTRVDKGLSCLVQSSHHQRRSFKRRNVCGTVI